MSDATDTSTILRELARAKAEFQLRAIRAVICDQPKPEPKDDMK